MKRKVSYWLKLTGLAFLLHIILIIISILEVAFYSYVINTGHTTDFYSEHAERSGPFVSAIFGALFIFLWVRRVGKKDPGNAMHTALFLPLIYIALDVIILIPAGVNWEEHYITLIWANGAKVLAGYLAVLSVKTPARS